MPIIQTVVHNRSRYPIDVVWENAQDLEHVAFLHRRTNADFSLLYAAPDPGSPRVYDTMIYTAKRKLRVVNVESFGFRRIIARYNLHQVERIPALGVTSALNSLLFRTDDPIYPTRLVDEVVMDVPAWLLPFKDGIFASLRRHTAIQCSEDEPYRERRQLLADKGIKLPWTIYNRDAYGDLTSHFKEALPGG